MISIAINGRTLTGQPGETILEVARRAGIDIPALCAERRLDPFDSCGVCVVEVAGRGIVKACSTSIAEGMEVLTDSTAAHDVRKVALELLLSNHWGDCVGPCQEACPAHTDCQAYVSLAGNGRFEDALRVLYEYLPLPACFGRVCPAPCEDACRRQLAEEPVQIRHLKRFLGDLPVSYVPPVEAESGKRIAVVGGGPAGLSAAYFLRRRGHSVILFEAMPHMGGMLRYGIPEYRLPQSVIDREVDVLRQMGIEFRNGVKLGEQITLSELDAEYDAVFVGLGAWGIQPMGLAGEDHPGVMQGTDFLRQVNEGNPPRLPKSVAVIGGGNTAMDAARCARRLGSHVTVLYRRTQEEMPALAHEIKEAADEGVEFRFLTQPVEFVGGRTHLRGIRCVRMELGRPDESGRRRPIEVEGSEFVVDVEAALLAVGQAVDSSSLVAAGVDVTKRGTPVVDARTGQTSRPKVFCGGDMVTGPGIAVEAVGAGRRAAEAIQRFLTCGDAAPSVATYAHVKHDVTRDDIGNPATAPRTRTPVRPIDERVGDFAEYETGLSGPQAIAAGQRCLECGCMAFGDCRLRDYATDVEASQETYAGGAPRKLRDERHPFLVRKVGKCVACGRCVRVCADVCGVSAIDFVGRGIETEVQAPFNRAWQDSACVACGACVDTCPTGALYDRTLLGKQVPLDLERTETACSLCGLGCDIASLTLSGAYMGSVPSSDEDVLCARGRYGWHAVKDAPRITSPMIRHGSALMEVSWSEALDEAKHRLVAARGSTVVFGTGLLTCEEGWLTSRLAESLGAGAPIFDVNAAKTRAGVRAGDIVGLDALDEPGRLIVAVGPRAPYEKVALDVILSRAIRRGSVVISVGAQVPGAHVELPLLDLERLLLDFGSAHGLLRGLAGAHLPPSAQPPSPPGLRAPLLLIEERTISSSALEHVAAFLRTDSRARLVVVPATANAIGLRRLGFTESLKTSARAWLAVGADPVATAAGRQHLPGVETLVAVSATQTMTTARAHVVFPMRWPYETRGTILTASGTKFLSAVKKAAIPEETWEVLSRLAAALEGEPTPEAFDDLSRTAVRAAENGPGGTVTAGVTPAGIACAIDRRLAELGI
jgi:formate dehydrogenase major subunit